jgi:hypothetical protein
MKHTKDNEHSIYGQWINTQFLNKPVGNRSTERPTKRLCDQTQQIHSAGFIQMKVSYIQLHNKDVTTGNRTYKIRRYHHQISPGTHTVVEQHAVQDYDSAEMSV